MLCAERACPARRRYRGYLSPRVGIGVSYCCNGSLWTGSSEDNLLKRIHRNCCWGFSGNNLRFPEQIPGEPLKGPVGDYSEEIPRRIFSKRKLTTIRSGGFSRGFLLAHLCNPLNNSWGFSGICWGIQCKKIPRRDLFAGIFWWNPFREIIVWEVFVFHCGGDPFVGIQFPWPNVFRAKTFSCEKSLPVGLLFCGEVTFVANNIPMRKPFCDKEYL